MYKVDFDKPVKAYFMGIGGISMSGLAEVLLQEGFNVCGSDMKSSDVTKRLEELGADVKIGQVRENITEDIDVIIYTAAIHPDNPEYARATELSIPMLKRAELLGQIMEHYKYSVAVAGTHGKTTTTSMMSYILMEAKLDPTVSIGGMLDAINGNIRVGKSDYFITEACEYTNSYHALNPFVTIILNVDADHLDFFKNLENIKESFKTFAGNTVKGGVVVLNGDMDSTDFVASGTEQRVITFGLKEGNDYRAEEVSYDEAGLPTYTLISKGHDPIRVSLGVPGLHNVMNSMAAIASADYLGVDRGLTLKGLGKCKSAKRRFEKKGVTSAGVTVIDDYAHHPTEIAATLKSARELKPEKLCVIFQPHTYSRTKALLDEFAEALKVCDEVLLADIYAAREKDDGSVSSKDLAELIRVKGGNATYLGGFDKIEEYVINNYKKNYLLITMGAGNVDSIGDNLVKK